MSLDVDTICSEDDLAAHLAGQLTTQTTLLPPSEDDATKVRTKALEDVLAALARRTPPIRETDLATPTELKRAVQYGAEMWLYWGALSTVGDTSVFAFKYTEARKRFDAEVNGLMPTLSGGLRGSTFSFGISRR